MSALVLLMSGRELQERRHLGLLAGLNAVLEGEVEERLRAEAALSEQKEQAEAMLMSIAEGVIRVQPDGMVGYLNPVAERLTGWAAAEAVGQPIGGVLDLRLLGELSGEGDVPGLIRLGTGVPVEGDLHRRDGSVVGVRCSPNQLRGGAGVVIVISDVTAVRKQVREAEHEANHDPLTGLVNRREFKRRVDRALVRAREGTGKHVLAFIDLDRFKAVNDTHGHLVGDQILVQVADVFRGCIRADDTLARLGGDEFGLLLPDCPLERAQQIAQRLVSSLQGHRFAVVDVALSVGASVGLVGVGSEAVSTGELIARADLACYAAKERGRGCVEVYSPPPDGDTFTP